jgi:hypothetical protein
MDNSETFNGFGEIDTVRKTDKVNIIVNSPKLLCKRIIRYCPTILAAGNKKDVRLEKIPLFC